MRILEFVPADNEINVKTYSPYLSSNETDADSEFTLTYEMSSSFEGIGVATGVASGDNAAVPWPGLSPLTEYEWYVTVSDEVGSTTGPTWTFTTDVTTPPLSAGDVIISGFQAWNTFGEFVELFNTTDRTISLENVNLITRAAPSAGGAVGIDWQLASESPILTGKSIAPHSYFLIGEAAVSGTKDLETPMDLATGEGGANLRAIGLELVIDDVHMDYVLYGRSDGSDAESPEGDIFFDGTFPAYEVIRNTTGDNSFQEGIVRRESAEALYAGYDVEGLYTDEDSLGDGNPVGHLDQSSR